MVEGEDQEHWVARPPFDGSQRIKIMMMLVVMMVMLMLMVIVMVMPATLSSFFLSKEI